MTLQAFHVLHKNGVNVQMISQGASKVMHELTICLFYSFIGHRTTKKKKDAAICPSLINKN